MFIVASVGTTQLRQELNVAPNHISPSRGEDLFIVATISIAPLRGEGLFIVATISIAPLWGATRWVPALAWLISPACLN